MNPLDVTQCGVGDDIRGYWPHAIPRVAQSLYKVSSSGNSKYARMHQDYGHCMLGLCRNSQETVGVESEIYVGVPSRVKTWLRRK